MNWSLVLSSLVIVASPASAWQYISPDGLPSDTLSDSCVDALVVDLDCPSQVSSFFEREPVPLESLEEACTSACRVSLAEFEESLKTQCGEEDVVEYDLGADAVHVSVVATDIYYHFNRTCIKDGDRWCNIWAFENSPDNDSDSSGSAAVTATASVDMCDNCVIKPFQFMAGNSYSNGFALQADYSTLTESCSKTSFPLSTTATEEPSTTDPVPTCSGEEYTIHAGDTCQSISEANDVATAWMLYDNGLQAFCAGFPDEGEKICIVNQCKTHTIQANDTCQGIAIAAKISMVQLYTWNPVLGPACNRMSLSVGDTICLEPHDDEDYTAPTQATTTTPTPEPTAAPVPSNVAAGTNENCALYYSVQPGDYCNQIILKFSISLVDFLFLNQGINAECTNLFAEESYCVAPVGPINLYPGHPDYVEPSSTMSDIPFSDLPKATFVAPSISGLPTQLPRAKGTRNDCVIYMDGTELQIDITSSLAFSACQKLIGPWNITLAELHNWNPSLNITSPDCAFSEEYSYCMAAYLKTNDYATAPASEFEPDPEETATDAPETTTTDASETTTDAPEPTSVELPIRDGAAEDCKTYYPVVTGQTCQEVLDDNNLTIAEFYAMNPAIGAQCTNLWPEYRYCVEV